MDRTKWSMQLKSFRHFLRFIRPTCSWLKCCFTSTETVGLLETGAQDGHLDFHTAPELDRFVSTECVYVDVLSASVQVTLTLLSYIKKKKVKTYYPRLCGIPQYLDLHIYRLWLAVSPVFSWHPYHWSVTESNVGLLYLDVYTCKSNSYVDFSPAELGTLVLWCQFTCKSNSYHVDFPPAELGTLELWCVYV